MSNHLTPLEVCERLIAPLPELERIAGYRPKASYAWLRPSRDRASGEFPSVRLMQLLLDHSDAHRLGLTALHLIRGADEAEIAAILAARAPQPPAMEAAE
jgi:hypothetical protein